MTYIAQQVLSTPTRPASRRPARTHTDTTNTTGIRNNSYSSASGAAIELGTGSSGGSSGFDDLTTANTGSDGNRSHTVSIPSESPD